MLTAMVVANCLCLAGVAALWAWWRRYAMPAERAAHFAATLEAARRREHIPIGPQGDAAW